MQNDILNPQRLNRQISQMPEVLEGIHRNPEEDLTPEEIRAARIAAIGNGASALARKRELEYGDNDLDTHLLNLTATINDFYEAHKAVEPFDNIGAFGLKGAERDEFKANKNTIIEFNHILRDVIKSAGERFDFTELLQFMTHQYKSISLESNTQGFYDAARRRLAGIRNEVAIEQILTDNGVDFELGTIEDDALGGDFIINGKPIDIKSSMLTTKLRKEAKEKKGYDSSGIVWSRIEFEDFEGKLTLPESVKKRVSKYLIPKINEAAGTNYEAIAS